MTTERAVKDQEDSIKQPENKYELPNDEDEEYSNDFE
jgi:hypothetical protein